HRPGTSPPHRDLEGSITAGIAPEAESAGRRAATGSRCRTPTSRDRYGAPGGSREPSGGPDGRPGPEPGFAPTPAIFQGPLTGDCTQSHTPAPGPAGGLLPPPPQGEPRGGPAAARSVDFHSAMAPRGGVGKGAS